LARTPLPCVGGPLDGHALVPAPGKYTWVSGRRLAGDWLELRPLPGQRPTYLAGGTGRSEPRNGCALYERDRDPIADRDVLIYAGHRVYLCGRCGTYHGKCEGGNERRPCALGGTDG
jgi:hypothetical protein